jgi:hypothetical protein
MSLGKVGEDISRKISEYKNRASISIRCHYFSSTIAEQKNYWLGAPVVIITALVGTSIFGTLQENPSVPIKIAAGILSISATVLAALQTYLGLSEKSAKHKAAGAKYSLIRRHLDILDLELRTKGDEFASDAIKELKNVTTMLDEAAKESPTIADRIYDIAVAEQGYKSPSQSEASQESTASVAS